MQPLDDNSGIRSVEVTFKALRQPSHSPVRRLGKTRCRFTLFKVLSAAVHELDANLIDVEVDYSAVSEEDVFRTMG